MSEAILYFICSGVLSLSKNFFTLSSISLNVYILRNSKKVSILAMNYFRPFNVENYSLLLLDRYCMRFLRMERGVKQIALFYIEDTVFM